MCMYEHVDIYLEFHSKHLASWIHHNTHLPWNQVLNFGVGSPEQLGCSKRSIFWSQRTRDLGQSFFSRCRRLGSKGQECIETILYKEDYGFTKGDIRPMWF